MKLIKIIVLSFGVLCLGYHLSIAAAEKATRAECEAKCKEAANLFKKVGKEEAFKQISDKNGPFVWKDTYLFVADMQGVVIVHPILHKLAGKDMSNLKDANGKLFVAEYISIAQKKGKGWVDYMWPKPGEKTPSLKSTYVYKVPGADYIMCSGIYLD